MLARFLLGKTRTAVLAMLYRDPGRAYYLRQIIRGAGGSPGTVQREVRQLVEAGLITCAMQGKQAFYNANRQCPVYLEIRAFLGKAVFSRSPGASAAGNIFIPRTEIADFCRRNHIKRLSLFGSVLRDDFKPGSDIDVLVEFEPGKVPGWDFFSMQEELSRGLGRRVDLVTPQDLSRHIRDNVVREAQAFYGN